MILALIASLQCGMAETLDGVLRGGYEEVPQAQQENLTLYGNSLTGTWTVLEIHGDVACVKGVGVGFMLRGVKA